MRRLLLVLPIVILTGACGAAPLGSGDRATTTNALAANGTIAYVSDGDTVGIRFGGALEDVRLIGIDTPEVKDPNEPVQCFGPEASDVTKRLLPKGTSVRVERDAEPRDQYGRLLGYVYRAADGAFVNLELARLGYADVLSIPPNVAHASELRDAVTAARQAGLGLWGACESFGAPAG